MGFYGHGYGGGGSWIFVAVFVGFMVVRSMGGRRRRGRAPGWGPTGNASAFTGGHPTPGGPPPAPGAPLPPPPGPRSVEPAHTGVDAGWLPDPSGRHQERYWSGTTWTEHVRDAGVPDSDVWGTGPPPPSDRPTG